MWTETEMHEVHPDPVGAVLRCTHPNFAHTRRPNLS